VKECQEESVGTKTAELPIFTEERKENCLRRLRAAEGQLRGVQEMIAAQRPCLEVLTQLAAAQSALRQVSRLVLRNYVENCATQAIRHYDAKAYDELMEAIFKFSQ
jgi:DNA-binding FrmR family transcriptional regulator